MDGKSRWPVMEAGNKNKGVLWLGGVAMQVKCRRPKQGRAIQWERSVMPSFLELAGDPPEFVRRAAGNRNWKHGGLRATTVL